ncbi:MAG: helix-turn-helix domain-containing protein [Clostridia bacterium]|nr:helix-turn-helix domain-containing protein [Clostridia bacterium]
MNNTQSLFIDNISLRYFCGEDRPQGLCGDHCHDEYEITYLINGEGRYIIEGCDHKVSHGTLLLITPMSYHRVELNPEIITEGYSIHFNRLALSEAIYAMLDRITCGEDNRGRIFSPVLLSEELASTFDRFTLIDRLSADEGKAYMQLLLSEILILLSAAEGERIIYKDDELGARVARYINLNIEKNVSLDRIARRFFVSKYYLCRAFKSFSGTSVHAYINQKRIIYAKQLIDSGLTASKAAERVGFGDYSAFYRSYVKIIGKSPTAN